MSMSNIDLVNTGILMGIIHVLTGPDHLSALATLSGTNISSKLSYSNFLLGIRWGIGHSVGLLVVGSILIAMEEETSSEWIGMDAATSMVLESFVGVFMLCLGCYGFAKACRNRREAGGGGPMSNSMTRLNNKGSSGANKQGSSSSGGDLELLPSKTTISSLEDSATSSTAPKRMGSMPTDSRRTSMEIITQMSMELNRDGDSMRRNSQGDDEDSSFDDVEARIFNAVESLRQNAGDSDSSDHSDVFLKSLKSSAKGALSKSIVNIYSQKMGTSIPKASSLVNKHSHENSIVLDPPKPLPSEMRGGVGGRCSNICVTPGKLAFVAGIVHGVAGPGGVLGVIPAVQLRDAKMAIIYLGTFCFTSTLVMGGFSAFYGVFSQFLAGGSSSTGAMGRPGRSRYSRVFLVEIGSAFLSIAVGVIWLVLLAVGDLDEVFHKL